MKPYILNSCDYIAKLRCGDKQELLAFVNDVLEKSHADPEVVRKMDELFILDHKIFWDTRKDQTIMRVINMLPSNSLRRALTKAVNLYHSQMVGGITDYLKAYLAELELRLKAEKELLVYKTAIEKLLKTKL